MSSSQSFALERINPTGLADPKPLFSHVTTASGDMKLIYIAGEVGQDDKGKFPASYEEQVKKTVENLGIALAAAGATVADILKATYYIVNYDATNRPHVPIVLDFYKGHCPATVLIPVKELAFPGLLFEMDIVAAVPRSRSAPVVPKPLPDLLDATVDVVVVGGGLSGLQAGYSCQEAGLSALVLEARNRVGGKTWSAPGAKGKGYIELGGAWINDTNQSHMYELARKMKLDLLQQRTTGDCVLHDVDGSLSRFVYGDSPGVCFFFFFLFLFFFFFFFSPFHADHHRMTQKNWPTWSRSGVFSRSTATPSTSRTPRAPSGTRSLSRSLSRRTAAARRLWARPDCGHGVCWALSPGAERSLLPGLCQERWRSHVDAVRLQARRAVPSFPAR